ncbi:hypothetical protein JCM11641_003915 [Rhodosporidiobolus odoratus]
MSAQLVTTSPSSSSQPSSSPALFIPTASGHRSTGLSVKSIKPSPLRPSTKSAKTAPAAATRTRILSQQELCEQLRLASLCRAPQAQQDSDKRPRREEAARTSDNANAKIDQVDEGRKEARTEEKGKKGESSSGSRDTNERMDHVEGQVTASASVVAANTLPDGFQTFETELYLLRRPHQQHEGDEFALPALQALKALERQVVTLDQAEGLGRPLLFSRLPPSATPAGPSKAIVSPTTALQPKISAVPATSSSSAEAGPSGAKVTSSQQAADATAGSPASKNGRTEAQVKAAETIKALLAPLGKKGKKEVTPSKPDDQEAASDRSATPKPRKAQRSRTLLPFSPDELDAENRITFKGLVVTIPDKEGADHSMLSDKSEAEQLGVFDRLARLNEEQHNFHHAAIPSDRDLRPELRISSSLPNAVISPASAAALYAFQPIEGTALTRGILRGEVEFVEELDYLIETFVRGTISGEPASTVWRRFLDSRKVYRFVDARRRMRDLTRLRAGLDAMVEKGMWKGERHRISAYNGRSGRFDGAAPGKQKTDVIRPFQHIHTLKSADSQFHHVLLQVVQLFREEHPEADMITTIVFVGDGKGFPDKMGDAASQRGEAWIGVSRWTAIDFGGAAKISGGKVSPLGDQAAALKLVPSTLTLAQLRLVPTFSLAIIGALAERYPETFTVAQMKEAFAHVMHEAEAEKEEKRAKSRAGTKPKPKVKSRFAASAEEGGSDPAPRTFAPAQIAPSVAPQPPQPQPSTVSSQPLVLPFTNPDAVALVTPFRNEPFFTSLCSDIKTTLSLTGRAHLGIASGSTMRIGIAVHLEGIWGANGTKLKFLVASGSKVHRLEYSLTTSARGAAVMRWDGEAQELTVAQQGKIITIGSLKGDKELRFTGKEAIERTTTTTHTKNVKGALKAGQEAFKAILT